MSLRSLLAALRSVPPLPRARAAWFRPRLEPLEGRCLPSLSPAASLPVGANPQAVVTGDFNGDGKPDLATANAGAGTVTVRLGDGLGGFGPAAHSAAGTDPRSLALGDFDADGRLDLATASPTGGDVNVLPGNGDGTFRPPVNTYVGYEPLSVAVGDFDADGKMDLAVSAHYFYAIYGYDYGYVAVLMGDGQGGFAAQNWYQVAGGFPSGLAVADLNADGKPDVVTANEDYGTVSVLLGNGDGTLDYSYWARDFATGWYPRAVAVGDFTGDGVPDLVTAGWSVDVLPGRGDGTFAAPVHTYATGSARTAVAVGDFNGDGKPDVVTADPAAGVVSAFLGWGDGTFALAADHAAGSSPTAVAVGDFNRDGRPDVVAASAGSNAASVLRNDGAWPALVRRLRIDDVTVTEGNTGTAVAAFTVTLSAASDQPVTVRYTTADGTAGAGADYLAATGTLTFAPGETRKTVAVQVVGDRLAESDETFTVRLSDPVNAPIADDEAVGTVRDNEPRIAVTGASVREGNNGQTVLTFTVTLSAAYDQAVTVRFATRDGTARTSDRDYTATSGTLTFAAGETTKTIRVTVKADKRTEADESLSLLLSGPSGNALLTNTSALGWILNDD